MANYRPKDGLVAILLIAEHLCRIILAYREKAIAVLDIMLAAAVITRQQYDDILLWLNLSSSVCTALQVVNRYRNA